MISIIVPVLNEERTIRQHVQSLLQQQRDIELIVVDGGSTDRTLQEIASLDNKRIQILTSDKGRARQMNAGARTARGDVLLFLHADSVIEKGALQEMETALRNDAVVGGGFRLALVGQHRFHNAVISFLGNLKARVTGTAYGDAGFFVRAGVFRRVGGYPDQPLMEDVELPKRLKREGKVVRLRKHCFTSGRRFEEGGYLRTLMRMLSLRFFYAVGIDASTLKQLYAEIR